MLLSLVQCNYIIDQYIRNKPDMERLASDLRRSIQITFSPDTFSTTESELPKPVIKEAQQQGQTKRRTNVVYSDSDEALTDEDVQHVSSQH
jgi:hypothetical protein